MKNGEIDKNIASIKLESLKGLFAYGRETLKFLSNNGVTTVEDFLLEKYKDIPEDIFSSLGEETRKLIKHDISIAERLLECKYLGIDPHMNIEMYDSFDEVADVLGFSKRTTFLLRKQISYEQFMNIVKEDRNVYVQDLILAFKGIGNEAIDEIFFKTSVVLKYYNDSSKKENISASNDESMYLELVELSKQVKELDKRIDIMLEKMSNKTSSENKKTYTK